MAQRRTAVIGSGVAGLTAAYLLRDTHEVTLYEADGRLGGHAHTHEVRSRDGRLRRVDSGFIVHNERTYPHLLRLFAELGVDTRPTGMSMSVRCAGCGLEYAGARGARGLFARPGNALRARYLRLLAEVPRFHRAARRLLSAGDGADADGPGADGPQPPVTLGGFLTAHGFSRYFTDHFAVPLVSAVWSCPPGTALRYPARYLFRFLDHHGMLTVSGSPRWRTVTGGSRAYVDRIAEQLPDIRTSTPVRSVRRGPGRAEVTDATGGLDVYDSVVVAVHPDQALRLLADPTPQEARVLGAFPYSRNPAVLHTDTGVLPRSSGARAAWNFALPSCGHRPAADGAPAAPDGRPDSARVRVSYDMSRLQHLDAPETYVVTLGDDGGRIPESRVLARTTYEHPLYTPESVAAQRRLPDLTTPVTAYAGAYHGWGFHEDGCRSGVAAAAALGVTW